MTGPQKAWLDANKPYRALGQRSGSGARYVKIGMLHVDGTFELQQRGVRLSVRQGSFEVGILEMTPQAGMQSGVRR